MQTSDSVPDIKYALHVTVQSKAPQVVELHRIGQQWLGYGVDTKASNGHARTHADSQYCSVGNQL